MAEYIERTALRDALYFADAITMQGMKILNQYPAVDVAPVRQQSCKFCYGAGYTEEDFTVTTQLGRTVRTQFNFCPNCGRNLMRCADE